MLCVTGTVFAVLWQLDVEMRDLVHLVKRRLPVEAAKQEQAVVGEERDVVPARAKGLAQAAGGLKCERYCSIEQTVSGADGWGKDD